MLWIYLLFAHYFFVSLRHGLVVPRDQLLPPPVKTSSSLPHTNPFPSTGRDHGLNGPTHLCSAHALHLGLADRASTPAPRNSSNKLSQALFRTLQSSRI